MKLPEVIVLTALLSACGNGSREVVLTSDAPQPIGPYSQAVKSNGLLFLSGQIALRGDGTLDTTSVESECRQVMENIGAVLKAADSGFDKVCKATIYTTDLKHFATINEVYGSYFGSDPPARETVQVSALPKGARVEISVVAGAETVRHKN